MKNVIMIFSLFLPFDMLICEGAYVPSFFCKFFAKYEKKNLTVCKK